MKRAALTMEHHPSASLLSQLPAARGSLTADAPLQNSTWFRVGGNAEMLFKPADENDLCYFLKNLSAAIPVTILGLASNVIVRDGGIAGVVIRLGPEFRSIAVDGNHVTAGAGAVDALVARAALSHSLKGLEFLSGIPGSIGGALRMNAGAYGSEIKDVLVSARAVDRNGAVHTLTAANMGFSYRHSGIPEDWVFVSATLKAEPGDHAAIAAKMDAIQKARGETQPIRSYTGGSTFANPDGKKAWELIDAAGCRGLRIGGAEVSTQHCNFLINTGNASAADLETLGETVRARVQTSSGIDLRWEIKRFGDPLPSHP